MNKLLFFSFKKVFSNKNSLFTIFLSIITISILFFLAYTNSNTIRPKISLVIEDDSKEISIFMNSIIKSKLEKTLEFQENTYEEAIEDLKNGDVFAVIRVKENSIDKLFQGEKVNLELYLQDENSYMGKILINYISSLIEVLNSAQNSGIIYMNTLYEKGYSRSKIKSEFTKMYIDYVRKFTSRNKSISGYGCINIFYGKNPAVFYYYTFVLIFLSIFDIYLSEKSLSSNKVIKKRLLLSGYSKYDLEISTNLFISIFLLSLGIIMDNLTIIFFRETQKSGIFLNFKSIFTYILIIRIIMYLIERIFPENLNRLIKYAFIIVLFLISGVIIPRYFTPIFFDTFLTTIHKALVQRW